MAQIWFSDVHGILLIIYNQDGSTRFETNWRGFVEAIMKYEIQIDVALIDLDYNFIDNVDLN